MPAIGATFGLAALLFAASLAAHLAILPAGSLANLPKLKPGVRAGFWAFLYFSALYWTFATSLFRLHPPMGRNWAATACRWSTVLFCVVIAEVFTLAASVALAPSMRDAAGVVWMAGLIAGTVLSVLMAVTLVEAARVRRMEEQKKVAANLAFLEEAR